MELSFGLAIEYNLPNLEEDFKNKKIVLINLFLLKIYEKMGQILLTFSIN